VWSYIFGSMLRGNAYLWKVKVRNDLRLLYPINPAFVTPKYEGNSAVFELRDRQYGPVVKEAGKDQVIHIPGILLEDPYVGVSVVEAHRQGLGIELGRQRFEGRYIANDATPGEGAQASGQPRQGPSATRCAQASNRAITATRGAQR
jgi:phage portal protein BeeE